MTSAQTPASNSYDSIQILRAVAAMAVVVFHLCSALQTDLDFFAENLFPLGSSGVDMFFVISGFIICHAARNETSSGRFMLKRLFRILPLYYTLTLFLFLVAIVAPSLLNSTSADPIHLAKSLLFIPYDRPDGMIQPLLFLGWTLNYEMFFYLIFAVCLKFTRRPEIFVCVLVSAFVALGALVETSFVPFEFLTGSIMLNFVWGCLIYFLHRKLPHVSDKVKWTWPIAVAVLLIQNWFPLPITREFAAGLPSAWLLLAVLPYRTIAGPIGNLTKLIGDASYSLYLSHPYVLQVLVKVVVPVLGVSALSVGITSVVGIVSATVLAILSFKLLELPSNKWLRSRFLP